LHQSGGDQLLQRIRHKVRIVDVQHHADVGETTTARPVIGSVEHQSVERVQSPEACGLHAVLDPAHEAEHQDDQRELELRELAALRARHEWMWLAGHWNRQPVTARAAAGAAGFSFRRHYAVSVPDREYFQEIGGHRSGALWTLLAGSSLHPL